MWLHLKPFLWTATDFCVRVLFWDLGVLWRNAVCLQPHLSLQQRLETNCISKSSICKTYQGFGLERNVFLPMFVKQTCVWSVISPVVVGEEHSFCLFPVLSPLKFLFKGVVFVYVSYIHINILIGNEKEPGRCKKNWSSQIGCPKRTLSVSTASAWWRKGSAGQSHQWREGTYETYGPSGMLSWGQSVKCYKNAAFRF